MVADARVLLSAIPDQPLYNIKAAGKRTGIAAATLRAWERRYGLPSPNRTQQGYRLYSERDIAILIWLRQQIDQGHGISQAAQKLETILSDDGDLELDSPHWAVTSEPARLNMPRSPESLRHDLIAAFEHFDGEAADNLLTEAAALYTLETTVIGVLYQSCRELGARDEQRSTARSFALNYARQWLLRMLQVAPAVKTTAAVLVVGFPNERSEIDLLILTLLLRRQGFAVTYLGNDLDPSMLNTSLAVHRASLIVYYVDTLAGAAKVNSAPPLFDADGRPVGLAYGGRIAPPDTMRADVEYLGPDVRDMAKSIALRLNRASDT